MKPNLTIQQVLLDPSILNHRHFCEDIVQHGTGGDGHDVLCMHCTSLDVSHPYYLEMTVLTSSNGEPRKVLLNHQYVVAILEVVNQQNLPGFLREESHEQ